MECCNTLPKDTDGGNELIPVIESILMKALKNNMFIPHPFPYQGSKRGIAKYILPYIPTDTCRLIEPFCGAGAVSIAAAAHGLANQFLLNDLNEPLMNLWKTILDAPYEIADNYEKLWYQQRPDKKEYFFHIRNEFNSTYRPHHLLYLLARIVKGSVRYSSNGSFNQSADNRRAGMHPKKMRRNIFGVSRLLSGKTSASAVDYCEIVKKAEKHDWVYMDPPYQGTSLTRDHRYCKGLSYDDFVDTLLVMNKRDISYVISYDGSTGTKSHGKPLPSTLLLRHLHVRAGRSTQATLLGSNMQTIESLYLSPALVAWLEQETNAATTMKDEKQMELAIT